MFNCDEENFTSSNAWISLLLIKERKKVQYILDIKMRSIYKEKKEEIHLLFLKAIF